MSTLVAGKCRNQAVFFAKTTPGKRERPNGQVLVSTGQRIVFLSRLEPRSFFESALSRSTCKRIVSSSCIWGLVDGDGASLRRLKSTDCFFCMVSATECARRLCDFGVRKENAKNCELQWSQRNERISSSLSKNGGRLYPFCNLLLPQERQVIIRANPVFVVCVAGSIAQRKT